MVLGMERRRGRRKRDWDTYFLSRVNRNLGSVSILGTSWGDKLGWSGLSQRAVRKDCGCLSDVMSRARLSLGCLSPHVICLPGAMEATWDRPRQASADYDLPHRAGTAVHRGSGRLPCAKESFHIPKMARRVGRSEGSALATRRLAETGDRLKRVEPQARTALAFGTCDGIASPSRRDRGMESCLDGALHGGRPGAGTARGRRSRVDYCAYCSIACWLLYTAGVGGTNPALLQMPPASARRGRRGRCDVSLKARTAEPMHLSPPRPVGALVLPRGCPSPSMLMLSFLSFPCPNTILSHLSYPYH